MSSVRRQHFLKRGLSSKYMLCVTLRRPAVRFLTCFFFTAEFPAVRFLFVCYSKVLGVPVLSCFVVVVFCVCMCVCISTKFLGSGFNMFYFCVTANFPAVLF